MELKSSLWRLRPNSTPTLGGDSNWRRHCGRLIAFGAYVSATTITSKVFVPQEKLNEYAENAKHSSEPPERDEETTGTFKDSTKMTVFHYFSDGCDHFVRWNPAKEQERASGFMDRM